MADHKNRYPGAQPFSDDDFSRKVFFGRESASRVLADKIVANRMVVVYARSGLGKTSLLQAGVASRLREEGFLPLFARVNDVRGGPFHSVLQSVPSEAARQGIEYEPGLPESLWSFFKTAEFWRGDLLLTPVLILDQFEELFTLQSEQARALFLDQLSWLTRGARPPSSTSASEGLSEQPPAVRIVLSLREDYLGFLEEAAEHVPQIFDARFRLAPLDLHAAQEAILGPAAVRDPGFETEPFALHPDAVAAILDYLSQRRTRTVGETRRHVEPFQLQLICRRIEQVAAARQQSSTPGGALTMADVGGEAALTQTLRNFYRQSIRTLPNRRSRRSARRLSEEYLISPEGRRLSLEANEIRRQLELPQETLDRLVAGRLLRSENRSESTYYELSHDALVAPILAARRTQARISGFLGIGAGAIFFTVASLVLAVFFVSLTDQQFRTEMDSSDGMILLVSIGTAVVSAILLRASARSIFRYRRARADADQVLLKRSRFISGLSAMIGGLALAVIGLVAIAILGLVIAESFDHRPLPLAAELELTQYVDRMRVSGIGLDMAVYLITCLAMAMIGGRVVRWGMYRLAGYRGGLRSAASRDRRSQRSLLFASVKIVLAAIALLSAFALLGFSFITMRCHYLSPAAFPGWIPADWFSLVVVDCENAAEESPVVDLLINLVGVGALLFIAIPALRRGIASATTWFSRPSAAAAQAHRDSAEQFS